MYSPTRSTWSIFDKTFGSLYSKKGRPGKSTRLLVGLHYLKHAFNQSDESVVARLYQKVRVLLVKAAKDRGIVLRRSYLRLGKCALIMSGRYAHAHQIKRSKREQKRLKNFLGRVYPNFLRNCSKPDAQLAELLHNARRLLMQKRHDKNKLYSLYAPEVECIAKGKAHKKYEFGCKVSVVTTSKDNWVGGVEALHGNPFDGHTLKEALKQVKRLVGWDPQNAYAIKAIRGTRSLWSKRPFFGYSTQEQHKASESRWFKRRSAIKSMIGYMKQDHRLNRNYLKGTDGG